MFVQVTHEKIHKIYDGGSSCGISLLISPVPVNNGDDSMNLQEVTRFQLQVFKGRFPDPNISFNLFPKEKRSTINYN